MQIVIDKSYLQGSSRKEISRLCAEHDVIVTQVLFYELLTTSSKSLRKCVPKLPEKHGAYAVIPGVGAYLSLEAERHAAATPILGHKLLKEPRINPKWANDDFQIPADQKSACDEWLKLMCQDVQLFHRIARMVPEWFPELLELSDDNQRKTACNEIKHEVCKNPQNVRDFYHSLGIEGYPSASLISPSWVVFQHTQLNLLYFLDHFARYGSAISEEPPKRVEHDVHDLEYVIFGTLCSGLATDDGEMQANFKLACPGGELLSH